MRTLTSGPESPLLGVMREGVQTVNTTRALYEELETVHGHTQEHLLGERTKDASAFFKAVSSGATDVRGWVKDTVKGGPSPEAYSPDLITEAGYVALLLATKANLLAEQDENWKARKDVQKWLGRTIRIERPAEYGKGSVVGPRREGDLWLIGRPPYSTQGPGNRLTNDFICETTIMVGVIEDLSILKGGSITLRDGRTDLRGQEDKARDWNQFASAEIYKIFDRDREDEPLEGAYSSLMPGISIDTIGEQAATKQAA